MGKVNVVVWALCMFAVGVLGGLLFASLNRGSLGEVMEERDQLAEENAQLQEQVAAVRKETAAQLESAAGIIREAAAVAERKQAEAIATQQDLAEKLRKERASHVTTTEPPLKSQEVVAKPEWKQVATWTVRGKKSTETFETVRPVWRVGWKVPGGDRDWVTIDIQNADGELVDTIMGYGEDSSFVHVAPGTFYLEIMVSGDEATVAIEEPM
jgi:ATPase subunit of ABC transporter with duplicated ATPase domains